MIYTGIGSRRTPSYVLSLMTEAARELDSMGWILRSGGASGADSAFEAGSSSAEIYLPSPLYRGHVSPLHTPAPYAYQVAGCIHPVWRQLAPSVQSLIARNVHQIIGEDCKTLTNVVVCWTPDGCESHTQYSRRTGGTGTAIVLASILQIPVINIQARQLLTTADILEEIINETTNIQTDSGGGIWPAGFSG